MLLIVSSVFVCFNLPSYAMRIKAYIEVSRYINLWFLVAALRFPRKKEIAQLFRHFSLKFSEIWTEKIEEPASLSFFWVGINGFLTQNFSIFVFLVSWWAFFSSFFLGFTELFSEDSSGRTIKDHNTWWQTGFPEIFFFNFISCFLKKNQENELKKDFKTTSFTLVTDFVSVKSYIKALKSSVKNL